jgi:hypothetical protein
MNDLGNGYRQSDNLCVRCYGKDPEYENDTDLFEVCPDCGEIWEEPPEFSINQITAFYENAFRVGSDILRSILNDRETYIKAKTENPRWSDLTLEMANFSNQALRMLSICKHTFGGQTGHFSLPAPPNSLSSKAEIQEQHFFYLTRWIESDWSDEIAKNRMKELMDVMLSWREVKE